MQSMMEAQSQSQPFGDEDMSSSCLLTYSALQDGGLRLQTWIIMAVFGAALYSIVSITTVREVSKGFGNYRGGNSSSGGTCTSIVITLTCGPVVDILMGGLSLCFASVSKGLTTSAQQLQRSISSSSFSSSTNLITAPFRVLSRQNSLNINADNQNNNKRETNADSIPEKDWINVQGLSAAVLSQYGRSLPSLDDCYHLLDSMMNDNNSSDHSSYQSPSATSPSTASWEAIADEMDPSLSFKAWRRHKRNGLYELKSVTRWANVTIDDVVRYLRDPNATSETTALLDRVESSDNGMTEVIHWVVRYPWPMKPRDYVYVRRVLRLDSDTILLVSKSLNLDSSSSSLSPLWPNSHRIDDYCSVAVFKQLPDGSVESTGMCFEDSKIKNKAIFNCLVRKMIWRVVQQTEKAMRAYLGEDSSEAKVGGAPRPKSEEQQKKSEEDAKKNTKRNRRRALPRQIGNFVLRRAIPVLLMAMLKKSNDR